MTVLNVQTVTGAVGSLQSLSGGTGGFTVGDVAIADSYSVLGDGGGGDFYFEGPVPPSATITSASASAFKVVGATNETPIKITTSTPHPFSSGQSVLVSGVGGNTAANGTWIVVKNSDLEFSLLNSAGNGGYTGGGTASSVVITTSAPHGRGSGQRIAIVGATWTGGTGINGQWEMLGVLSATALSIPVATTGTYGGGGVIGDNGFVVPSTVVAGRWVRRGTSPNNPRWWGAKGDGTTDDLSAFVASMAAMGDPVMLGAGTLHVPPGTYFMSNTLHITRAIKLLGAGSDRFWNTSVLRFADGVVGLMTWHGGMGSPDGGRADGVCIENLTVTATGRSSNTAHGLWMRTPTRVTNCHFTGFGGNGIHITSEGHGFPDNWHVQWTRCDQNLGDGIHVHGIDTNNGVCVGGDFQSNVGWGVYDASFLGCTWVGCHTAENATGAYAVISVDAFSSLINCYAEADQPPSQIGGFTFVIGGAHGASFTPGSGFFGGRSKSELQDATFQGLNNISDLVASGTNPPRVALRGTLVETSVNVRIEVTTAGFPGGLQPDGQSGAQARVRWSVDGGSTWNGPVELPRADNANVHGLSLVPLGTTGLQAVFTPGFYALDDVFTASGIGGVPVQFSAGSHDGTFAVCSWQHLQGFDSSGGDSIPFRLKWSPSLKRWQIDWANSRTNLWFSSQFSLPAPGLTTFGSLWFGDPARDQNQIVAADGGFVAGTRNWHGTTTSPVGWFNPGDFILNRGATSRWPVAWRPTQRCGIGSNPFGLAQPWRALTGFFPGDSIVPTGVGHVFRALTSGTSGQVEPGPWPTTVGATIKDDTVTWENAGPFPPTFEALIVASPGMLTKDCSVGGSITLDPDETAHERYKLTGAPKAAFSVIIGSGAGGSWDRCVHNATTQSVTIQASSTDSGVSVPSGACHRLFNDGSAIIRVT